MKQLRAILRQVGLLFGWIALIIGLALVTLISWAAYLEYDVSRWDKKIDALCAANGGRDVATQVYETVLAPETKEYFAGLNPLRSFGIPERSEGRPLGPKYPYVMETRVLEVLNKKDPSVVRFTARIVRTSDNKILAERFGYQRAGGGMPGWDPSEIRTCPIRQEKDRLDVITFLNHPHRKELGIK